MKEILFKAKRKDNNEWIQGSLLVLDAGSYKIATSCLVGDVENILTVCAYDVDPDTICRYTGLTDKNDNKIWENDLLMFHSNKNDLAKASYGEFYVVNMENLEKIDSVIGWHYEVIETDAISKCEPFNISMPLTNDYIKICELEVISNIFDNKELLEGGETDE